VSVAEAGSGTRYASVSASSRSDSQQMGMVEMDLGKFSVFRMMSGKMRWLSSRQSVLSQNVANADTPKYRPKDLREVDFAKAESSKPFHVELKRTHEAHFGRSGEKDAFASDRERNPYETLPTGNAVVLEEQLMKVAQNRHDYELMTRLYRKHIQMFQIALGRNSQ
jgi:flagellar basal-body rod protein FlgB